MRRGLAVYKEHGRDRPNGHCGEALHTLRFRWYHPMASICGAELYAIRLGLGALTRKCALGSIVRSPAAADVLTIEQLVSERRDDALFLRKPSLQSEGSYGSAIEDEA
jgi:hypothetical protein